MNLIEIYNLNILFVKKKLQAILKNYRIVGKKLKELKDELFRFRDCKLTVFITYDVNDAKITIKK